MARVIIATIKPWNVRNYHRWAKDTKHESLLVQTPAELSVEAVDDFKPEYIFFPHWSHKIPATIYRRYECIVFHMTDLPFGRGGSPLQNLLVRGIYETNISAIRVVEAMDAGPIYLKRPLSLYGTAEEIYIRASHLIFNMIDEILLNPSEPIPQTGEVVEFKRRTPKESEIPLLPSLTHIHDFIRMLDVESYPSAYLIHEGFRYEFTHATLRDGRIQADVKITPMDDKT